MSIASRIIRRNPHRITVVAPLVAFVFTVGAGTSNIFFALIPVIYETAYRNGVRPERPLAAATVTSGLGITASPVSAAMAAFLTLLPEDFTLSEIYATVPGPEGSPTVMLYAHYDVQPAPPGQGWSSDPWTPTRKDDGRLYGRGIADDKSGLVIHAGTLKVFEGSPPCHLKLVVEGMEETNSNLDAFVRAHPDRCQCDVFIVADMGNLKVGQPTLTTTLRGDVACIVTVRTLQHPLHSGIFGGPTPDAMMALARLLATLHDADGNVAVEGVSSVDWDGLDFLRGGPSDRGRSRRGRGRDRDGHDRLAPVVQAVHQRDRPRHDRVRWINPVAAHLADGGAERRVHPLGAEDTAKARIHASDESVDPAEIEAMILAQVILLQELAS